MTPPRGTHVRPGLPVFPVIAAAIVIAGPAVAGIGCAASGRVDRARGEPADTIQVELYAPIADFEDARAMDLSPSMKLYVADAGADIVRIFDVSPAPDGGAAPDGGKPSDDAGRPTIVPARPGTIGGSGTEPGLFLEPSSVDASTALFVTVADAGNGRIQRFTSDGALVEIVPVPRGSTEARDLDPRFRADQPAIDRSSTGSRPVIVETTPSDDLLVVDDESGTVLMSDSRSRTWTTLGTVGSGPSHPVDIEFIGNRIFVADAASNRLFAYDRLGTLLETSDPGGTGPISAIFPTAGGPSTLGERYLIWPIPRFEGYAPPGDDPPGVARSRNLVILFRTSEVVRDARTIDGFLIVLTNRSLFVVPVTTEPG